MLVQDQYHPHCHVAIFSQGFVALRLRSQASARKEWNRRLASCPTSTMMPSLPMPPRQPVLLLPVPLLSLDMLRALLGSSMVAQPDSIRRLLHPRASTPTWVRLPGLMTLGTAAEHGPARHPGSTATSLGHHVAPRRPPAGMCPCLTLRHGTTPSRGPHAASRTCGFGPSTGSEACKRHRAWPACMSTTCARRWES